MWKKNPHMAVYVSTDANIIMLISMKVAPAPFIAVIEFFGIYFYFLVTIFFFHNSVIYYQSSVKICRSHCKV